MEVPIVSYFVYFATEFTMDVWTNTFFLAHNIPSPTSEPVFLELLIINNDEMMHLELTTIFQIGHWLNFFYKMFHYFLKDKF